MMVCKQSLMTNWIDAQNHINNVSPLLTRQSMHSSYQQPHHSTHTNLEEDVQKVDTSSARVVRLGHDAKHPGAGEIGAEQDEALRLCQVACGIDPE